MQNRLLQFLAVTLLLFSQIDSLQAQGWEQFYSKNTTTETTYGIRPTPGGYIMAGFTSSPSNATVGTLIQLDQRGDEIRRILNNNPAFSNSVYNDIEVTPDGGFIAAGSSRNIGNGIYNWYLIKYDATGAVEWDQVYTAPSGGTNTFAIYDVDVTADSGFICTGYFDAKNTTMKTNSLGVMEWRKDYGVVSHTGVGVVEMPNQSGYAIFSSKSLAAANNEYQLTRVDLQGDTLWTSNYPSGHSTFITGDIVLTNDGHFAVTGSHKPTPTSSNNRDLWVAKLDTTDGSVVWQQFYGRSPNVDQGYSIVNTLDGGLLASGISYNNNSSRNRLVRLDANGNTLWNKEFGPFGTQTYGFSACALADSSYVIAGRVGPFSYPTNSQSYAYKLNDDGELYGSVLSGQVYYDRDSSCGFNGNDIPLSNRTVYAYKDSTTVFYGSTDSAGNYSIRIDTGRYRIFLVQNYTHAYFDDHGCVPDTIITNIWFSGNNRTFDFPQVATVDCSLVEVSMGTPRLRRCFTNYYSISYCNYGTQDAINTDLEVVLDPYLIVDTLNLPAPVVLLPNNTFIFTVDTIEVGACGFFTIPLYVDCDSTVLGQTHCSQVSITPDTNCVVPPWAGANIQLDATCLGDSIRVVLRNVGGSMTTPLNYLVYEDNIMLRNQSFTLGAGQSQNFQFEATGNTYRIEAQQPAGFPALLGDSIVARVIERCNGTNSLGFVTSLPNYDGSPFLDVDCRQNIGAYDPNDKRGFPSGVGTPNYITKDNKLDYNIRFQNTGTDTAFTVVIIDTISSTLDIRTLQVGASSHAYTMNVYGETDQIIAFTFSNIMLVDSNTNEPLSHGFIQFTIEQKANNPLGTIINNEAAIYFDFNPPIFTNTTLHTVGENFIQVVVIGVDELEEEKIGVKVIPNPFQDHAVIQVEGLTSTAPLQLQVYNVMGQQVMSLQGNKNTFEIQRGRLDAGVYVFRIVEEGQLKATGKFIVR